MELNHWPACCGAYILTRFGLDDSCSTDPEVCKDYLLGKMAEHKNKVAMLVVILNTIENQKLGSTFKECGWVRVTRGWKNPRTDHGLNMWLWKCSNPPLSKLQDDGPVVVAKVKSLLPSRKSLLGSRSRTRL